MFINKLSIDLFQIIYDYLDFDDIIYEILTPKKHKEYSGSKLPSIASEFSNIGSEAGVSYEFLEKETEQLMDAIENFIKAIQKYGV